MQIYNSPFIEYPDVSFENIENIKIENPTLRIFYKSFFSTLHIPEKTLRSLFMLFTKEPL